jgi:anaerobic ribonucleoside-triphosphate reductase activating protein
MQPVEKRLIVDVVDLEEAIQKSREINGIEGVTFVGGEPLLQAEGVADIAKWCHENGLSVLVFTGFLYQELVGMHNSFVDALLANTDLLVDGPFVEGRLDYERDWVGSTNQKVIFLTDRYSPGIEKSRGVRQVECLVTEHEIRINGWPVKL